MTLTFDLQNLIGFILSPWLTCLPSLIKKSTTVRSVLCSQAYFNRCPLVTLTFDLWPPKSIRCNLSSRLTCLPSLNNVIHNGSVSMEVHKFITIDVHCDLDLRPLTSKINRVHPLITVNMSCKFDKEICNGLVSMVFTSVTIKKVWLSDRQTHARTHTQTDAGQSDPYVPLCFAGDTKLVSNIPRYFYFAWRRARQLVYLFFFLVRCKSM